MIRLFKISADDWFQLQRQSLVWDIKSNLDNILQYPWIVCVAHFQKYFNDLFASRRGNTLEKHRGPPDRKTNKPFASGRYTRRVFKMTGSLERFNPDWV